MNKKIVILYHFVDKATKDEALTKEHVFVDNQTDDAVPYFRNVLREGGYGVGVHRITADRLSDILHLDADYIFNLVDSKELELPVAQMLGLQKTPYAGATYKALSICNDKKRTKQLLRQYRFPTPEYIYVFYSDRIVNLRLPFAFPAIVKPTQEHCSVGITDRSIVRSHDELIYRIEELRVMLKQSVLIEEFIPGKELQVTLVENEKILEALPMAEMAFRGSVRNPWNIYGFEEKWKKDSALYKSCHFVAPPRDVPEEDIEAMLKDAKRAYTAFGLKDYGRVDLRYNPLTRRWYILEVNANPGLDPDPRDASTASANGAGLSLDDVVLRIVKNSLHE
ncbi:hypothetical protein KKB64_04395 [Patescibacteria group bacterium]|nr:hypothetical protein [Patescibacteria group bacterium]MBU2459950.1 hypothetical protein [Patescibacteria group bacterium]MBU2544796.1 hypothetical protein [Patescibacteria group bacterium]